MNPADPADPNAGQPAQDAPMGGTTYTPPAAPLGDQPTSEPVVPPVAETPAETPAPLGDQPTSDEGGQQPGGAPAAY